MTVCGRNDRTERAMAFGKSPEEKAAEKAAEQAQQEQQAAQLKQQREQAAFLASPEGMATTAKQQRQGFLELQLVVGSSQRVSSIFNPDPTGDGENQTATHAGTLAAVESIGWRLEHVGYIFLITGESSADRMFSSGQNTAVSGQTVGIYLFRNTDTVETAA
jgi:hypothetical protein